MLDLALEKKEETGLSTNVLEYKTKYVPKSVEIKIGKDYELLNGNGNTKVTITSIRKLEDDIIIYYKYLTNSTNDWSPSYAHSSSNLSTFKMQMLEYGQLESIDVLYPNQ